MVSRNEKFTRNFTQAAVASSYLFTFSWAWAVSYKFMWPELYEFDMDDIRTRGYGPTIAEATAIHYWGEECGTMECQTLGPMFIG